MSKRRVPVLAIVLVCLALVVLADALVQRGREIYIQGFFTNDRYDFFPAAKLEEEFASALSLGRRSRVCFEDGLLTEAGAAKDYYTMASESKIFAYAAAKELDFVVTTRENLEHWMKGLAMEDMRNLADGSLAGCLVMGRDGKGEEKAVALEMTASSLVGGRHPETPFYLFVPENSRRKEATRLFIAWAFGQSR